MRHFALHLTLASLALAVGAPARADVPSHDVYLTNAVEVRGLDKHPDWIVVVFPGAPPSGRPVAWPSLVEDGFQTVIDRKVLGKPKLWALPRTELDALTTTTICTGRSRGCSSTRAWPAPRCRCRRRRAWSSARPTAG